MGMGGGTGVGERIYHVGDRIQLTDYSGRQIIDTVMKVERSILSLDCTSKLYLKREPATPHLLDSFQEFETLGIEVIGDGKNLALLIGGKNENI